MADEGHRDQASPQEVWAILRELSASQRETDRRMQETDRLMRENARRIRELDELFNRQWGKLMEALVKGDLVALLNRRSIEVDLVFTNVERNYGGRRWEIDILAVNGAELVAVEVKTTLGLRRGQLGRERPSRFDDPGPGRLDVLAAGGGSADRQTEHEPAVEHGVGEVEGARFVEAVHQGFVERVARPMAEAH